MKINIMDYLEDKPRFKTKWGELREKDLSIIALLVIGGIPVNDIKKNLIKIKKT